MHALCKDTVMLVQVAVSLVPYGLYSCNAATVLVK